jgi:hypothetical protein
MRGGIGEMPYYRRVRFKDMNVPLSDHATRIFERHFGRLPEPSDPVFFNPDSPRPEPMTDSQAQRLREHILASLRQSGATSESIYVFARTGVIVTREDGRLSMVGPASEIDGAVAEYRAQEQAARSRLIS